MGEDLRRGVIAVLIHPIDEDVGARGGHEFFGNRLILALPDAEAVRHFFEIGRLGTVFTAGGNKDQRQTGNESRSHGILLRTSMTTEKERTCPRASTPILILNILPLPGKGDKRIWKNRSLDGYQHSGDN